MKKIISWALYDWANSAFATTVMAGFFPVFFKEFWSAGAENSVSTFHLGWANALSSVIVALLAPAIGAVADAGGLRKRMLFLFSFTAIVLTCSLGLVGMGAWKLAILLYVLAIVGFAGGNVFYDSLMISVAGGRSMNLVSALGYGLGYLGGGLLFAVNVWMTQDPSAFGLDGIEQAIRVSFVMVGVWWALFSIPIYLFVPEPDGGKDEGVIESIRGGFTRLAATFAEARKLKVIFLFLIAYWLYIDGVDTIVRMAVDYGMSLGFDSGSLIKALLITQFVGFPAAVAMGWLGDVIGTKRAIYLCIVVYAAVTVYASVMDRVVEFYVLAAAIGLVQGGIQSLSRAYFTTLIPHDKSAEFFGLYNMMGKFAAVLGPLMVGTVSILTGSPRASILSIIVLFIIGAIFLSKVDDEEGKRLARGL